MNEIDVKRMDVRVFGWIKWVQRNISTWSEEEEGMGGKYGNARLERLGDGEKWKEVN